jgi:regulator of sigma E protease
MNPLLTILSLVIALSIMVFGHEFGHFIVAKRSKVVVEEFGFGYPPRLLSFWHTEGRIAVGGKQIVIPRKFRLPEGLQARSLVTYETTTDAKGREVLARIEQVDPQDPSAVGANRVELLDPGTVFTLNAIPFGGFAKMLGEEDPEFPGSLASKSKLTRIFVLSAGVGMNLLTAIAFFSLALGLGAPTVADPENAVVSSVSPGSPAEAAGLQVDDVILQADTTQILTIQDLQNFTQAHLGQSVDLTVQRGDQVLHITLVPRTSPPAGEGPMGISLSPRTVIKHYVWYQAIWSGLKETGSMTAFILTVPVQVAKGLIPANLARPVGPVGLGEIVGETVKYSLNTGWWFPVMQLMGSLSVSLAVTNLLPLPGLDGGRILFVVIEGIRGRRIDPSKEGLVHFIGLLLLVALMLFITWQDVVNPLPPVNWSKLF